MQFEEPAPVSKFVRGCRFVLKVDDVARRVLSVWCLPGEMLEITAGLEAADMYWLRSLFSEARRVVVSLLPHGEGDPLISWLVDYGSAESLPLDCIADNEGPAFERIILHDCRYTPLPPSE